MLQIPYMLQITYVIHVTVKSAQVGRRKRCLVIGGLTCSSFALCHLCCEKQKTDHVRKAVWLLNRQSAFTTANSPIPLKLSEFRSRQIL
jgi:hypothetical protein